MVMTLQQVLLDGQPVAAGQERRLLPGLGVTAHQRLHFHVSGGIRGIENLSIRVLFGTPISGGTLLADSTVWFEDTIWEREFIHQVPANYGRTGLVMSVPVVAPLLYDVILTNTGPADLPQIYVTVFAQD
jgi:hypothetical protein